MSDVIDAPQEGYWLITLAKKGAPVPACILRFHTTMEPGAPLNRMDRSPHVAAFICGDRCEIDEVWLRRRTPITKEEYDFRVRDAAWLRVNAPDDPKASPQKRVDFGKIKFNF